MKSSGQSVLKAALRNKNSLQPISVIIIAPKKTTPQQHHVPCMS